MRKLDSWRRGAASLLAGGVFVAFAAAQSTFEDAVAKYRERIQRPSLWKRTEGRRAIAETKDSRALALLVADYAKPEPPREVVRWLCVHLALEFFRSYEHADAWTAWRTAQAKPADAWLWRAALGVEARAGSDSWIEVAESRMPAVLRAVAIAAGVESYDGLPDSETLERFAGWLRDKRTYGVDREMLVESMLAHFDRRAASLLEPEHLAMLRDIAGELGNRQCSERSKLVIARLLARITGRENIGIDPEAWRALLADEVAEAVEVDYVRRRAARVSGFFGIPDRGRHVVYVIDASDSMLAPLTAAERGQLTGVEEKPSDADRASNAAANAIDWSRVSTRFDAARELLISSLSRLDRNQKFAVLLFGTKAEPLAATPKLVEPKDKVLERVREELSAIRPGPVAEGRPHGTLRGETNLHGGISRAFELTTKRALDREQAFIAVKSFDDACDTIYLLSDGAPSWDDFDCVDSNDGKWAGDPEAGTRYEHTGPLHYYGPFAWPPYLASDVRRMNMLRRCAIHVIGIGEADERLLEELAEIGHGRLLMIGK